MWYRGSGEVGTIFASPPPPPFSKQKNGKKHNNASLSSVDVSLESLRTLTLTAELLQLFHLGNVPFEAHENTTDVPRTTSEASRRSITCQPQTMVEPQDTRDEASAENDGRTLRHSDDAPNTAHTLPNHEC